MKYSVDEMNKEVVYVTQACIGMISWNIVSIVIAPNDNGFCLDFVIENDDLADRERIEEISDEFYAMHDDDPVVICNISVSDSAQSLPSLEDNARLVYRRFDER